jgi:hypothetical protein
VQFKIALTPFVFNFHNIPLTSQITFVGFATHMHAFSEEPDSLTSSQNAIGEILEAII